MKIRNGNVGLLLAIALVTVEPSQAMSPNAFSSTRSTEALSTRTGGVLVIQVRSGGFSPGEITRPAGYYMVLVNNVSGEPEVTLQLRREGEQRTHQMTLKRGRPWRQGAQLVPGVYLLTETNHPNWVCRITITAN